MQGRVLRTEALLLQLAAAAFVAFVGFGCGDPAVGEPSLPEQIPEGGFDPSEAYIESSSVQCETRVCMVGKLEGAPQGTPTCMQDPTKCASEQDVNDRWWGAGRCSAGNSRF